MNQLTQTARDQSATVPETARHLIDRLFKNLTASCPVLLSVDGEQLEILKQQWILGFAENGITTFEQVKRGMAAARTKANGFLPSVGEFVTWCKVDKYADLGLPNEEVLFRRITKFMFFGMEEADKFKFRSNAEYWLITKLYERNRKNGWDDAKLKREIKRELADMANRIASGESIPEPIKQLPAEVKKPITTERKAGYLSDMRAMLRGVAQ